MEIKPKEDGLEAENANFLVSKSKHKSPTKRFEEIMNSKPRKKRRVIIPEFEDSLIE